MYKNLMRCGIELPADLSPVEMITGSRKCLMYLHPKVAVDEEGWLKLMRGYVEGNIPLNQFFNSDFPWLVSTTGFPQAIPVKFEPGERIYYKEDGLSAMGSCFIAHMMAYRMDFSLSSFVYAATPLGEGVIQEFSRELVVPKKTPIPAGCVWQLLLATEPLPDVVQS